MKAGVSEKLGGVEEVSAKIMRYRESMKIRRATGDPGITKNPFTQTFSSYGHFSEVVSEEVVQ